MDKKSLILALLFCTHSTVDIQASQLLETAKVFLNKESDEREQQLEVLKKDFATLKTQTQDQLKEIQYALDQTNRNSIETKKQIKAADPSTVEFYNKKLSILNEMYQTIFNIQFLLKENVVTAERLITLFEEHTKDPHFKTLALEPRSSYSFSFIQNLNQKVLDQEDKLKHLTVQNHDAVVELDNRKKKVTSTLKEYQAKKRAQEEFSAKTTVPGLAAGPYGEFNFKQRGELIDLEERLYYYEKQLADLKVQESTRQIALINSMLFIESEKLKVLKENLAKAKLNLRVDESDVQATQEQIEKSKQESLAIKDSYYEEIKRLSALRETFKKELDVLRNRYKVPEAKDLTTWTVDTKNAEGYTAMTDMGYKNAQIQVLNARIDYLRAVIDLEEVKFRREEINGAIMNLWYKITQRKFRDNEEIAREIRRFKELEAEAQRELTSSQDKRNAATTLLNLQNKELTNLRNFIKEMQEEHDLLFKRYPIRFNANLSLLHDAERLLSEQIENNGKLLEVYSNLINTLSGIIKEINFIAGELETKSIWQRSQYAITWQGIKNIIPDLGYFIADVRQIGASYREELSWTGLVSAFKKVAFNPLMLLFVLIGIAVLLGGYLILRRQLPHLIRLLTKIKPEHHLVIIGIQSSIALLKFIEQHLLALYSWCILFAVVYFEYVSLYPRILFCLFSIVYLLYFVNRFVTFFISYNRHHHYVIFADSFERRFSFVFSLFAYLTIIVLLFRETFILATIHKSELPTILLAMYSIAIRTLVIFSIGKDEILAIIPSRGIMWNWLSYSIEHYYYPLLISIITLMIISDPYVGGYSSLVSYVLWGIVGTVILIRLFYAFHIYFKQSGSKLFFDTDEELIRERFNFARTWFGLSVIALFFVLVITGFFVVLRIWGIKITLQDINSALNFQLFLTGFDKSGQPIYFTPSKLFIVALFVLSGFVGAILINRLIWRRIFDLLPVDLGVQNTVASITRYFVVVMAIYLGFQWGGLGTLLIALGLVIGSIGYIVKEPIGDFISYFIILVQRPIQIGDYILLDDEKQGVVRQITPRSVILRRKDSYTIIVPNSTILNSPINNWNYGRNFIAFDDIRLTVPYSTDPEKIRQIIMDALEHNVDVLKSPRPIIRLDDFNEEGFLFMVRGFISNTNILRKWDIASDVRFALVKTFRQHAIPFAMPTRIIMMNDQHHLPRG